jgi:hypothetical protein
MSQYCNFYLKPLTHAGFQPQQINTRLHSLFKIIVSSVLKRYCLTRTEMALQGEYKICIRKIFCYCYSPDSSVGIATAYGLDGLGVGI